MFQDRFAVSAKWFHSACFWPVFRQRFRDVDHMQVIWPAAMRAAGAGWDQNDNKNKGEAPGQLARWISARIDRAAQMNNNAPTVVVTAADSSEYRTAWAP